MYIYDFFGKKIKRNKEIIENVFTRLTNNVMTNGTIELLFNLDKVKNQLLIDIKPTIGDYYLLPVVFNISCDVYEENEDIYNDVIKNVELNSLSNKVNTLNYQISNSKTLDELYETTNKNITYIKIDSSNKEEILKGGKNIISHHKPIIQMKWIYNTLEECSSLIELIKELNYKPLMIIGQDLFILPNEKYDELKHIKKPLHKSIRNIPIFYWINRF
jgi:hypothetical protein